MLRLMPHPLQFAFQSAGPLPARSLSCRPHRLLSRLLRMSENSSGAPPFRSPVRDCGVRRCVPQRNTPAPRPSFARLTDFRHAPAMSPPRAAGHSGSGNEPPVRSLSGRIVFSPAFSGCRRIHPGRRLSDRPCGIAASADAPRGPLSPVRRIFGTPRHVAAPCGGGGIPAPATNRPRRTAPEVRRPRAPQLRPYSSPEAPSPSRCVPFARSAKFARAQPAAFARIMRYARPLRMFACSETAPHET